MTVFPINKLLTNFWNAFTVIGFISTLFFLVSFQLPFIKDEAAAFYFKSIIFLIIVIFIAIYDLYGKIALYEEAVKCSK